MPRMIILKNFIPVMVGAGLLLPFCRSGVKKPIKSFIKKDSAIVIPEPMSEPAPG
jgi:hypothetical protein